MTPELWTSDNRSLAITQAIGVIQSKKYSALRHGGAYTEMIMHGRDMLLLVVAALAVVAAGCGKLSLQSTQQLDEGYKSYHAGDNAGTIRRMDAFLQENSRANRADEAYYLRGLARYNLKNYEAAKADLEQTVSNTRQPELRGRAALALGDLSFDTGDMTLAENMYRLAIGNLPTGQDLLAQGHYRLGCVLQRLAKWRQADQQFHKVIYNYPDTQPARRAARLINCTVWTIQAGAFNRMQPAQLAAGRLKQSALPAQAVAVLLDGSASYLVQVGRFNSYDEAAAMLTKVRKVQSDAFVVAGK